MVITPIRIHHLQATGEIAQVISVWQGEKNNSVFQVLKPFPSGRLHLVKESNFSTEAKATEFFDHWVANFERFNRSA